MRVTQRMIECWGWGVWAVAVWDAQQLMARGIDSRARRKGRSCLRSLYRTAKAITGEDKQEGGAR